LSFPIDAATFANLPTAIHSASGAPSMTASSGPPLYFDNNGTIRGDTGKLTILSAASVVWSNSLGQCKFDTSSSNATVEIHGPMSIPSNVTCLITGPGITRFYGDNTPTTVNGLLQVGVVDPTTHLFVPGNLDMERLLPGSGLAHVLGSNGVSSSLIWGNGTISLPEVDI